MERKKMVLKRCILLAGVLTLVILKTSTAFADPKQNDINDDSEVNISDLETMETEIIRADSRTEPCQADLNDDGEVNISDLSIMKDELGRDNCFTATCQADLNSDGKVNGMDGEVLITEFGRNDCIPRDGDALRQETEFLPGEDEGEETSFDTREGEKTEEGIEPPVSRFKDNGDGTVTDPETGLMWTKDANLPGDTMLFHKALDYTEEMNEGKYPNFGYTDWRLPTLKELRSLIDYTNYTGWGHGIPSGHPFQNVQLLLFNDSRFVTYLHNSEFPIFVSLYCRLVGHNVKSCYGYVWPVRGRQ